MPRDVFGWSLISFLVVEKPSIFCLSTKNFQKFLKSTILTADSDFSWSIYARKVFLVFSYLAMVRRDDGRKIAKTGKVDVSNFEWA